MESTFTMATIITDVTSFVTGAIDWVEAYLAAIVADPVLTTFVIVLPLVGLGVGLIARMFSLRA